LILNHFFAKSKLFCYSKIYKSVVLFFIIQKHSKLSI